MQIRTGSLGIIALILSSLALVLVLFGSEDTTAPDSDDASSIFDDSVGTKFSVAGSNGPGNQELTELSNRVANVESKLKNIQNTLGEIGEIRQETLQSRNEASQFHEDVQQIRNDLREAVNSANQVAQGYTEAINRLPDGFLTDIELKGTIRCNWGLITENMFGDPVNQFQYYLHGYGPQRHSCEESDLSSFDQNGSFGLQPMNMLPSAAVLYNIDVDCLAGPSPGELQLRNEPACGANLLAELRDPESATNASIFWSRAIIAIPLGDTLLTPRMGGYSLAPNISSCSTEIEGIWTARSSERLDYFYSLPPGRTIPQEAYYSSANASIIGRSWLGEGITAPTFDRGFNVETWIDRYGATTLERVTDDIFSRSLIISIAPQVDWSFVQLQNMDIPLSLQLDYELTITCTQAS